MAGQMLLSAHCSVWNILSNILRKEIWMKKGRLVNLFCVTSCFLSSNKRCIYNCEFRILIRGRDGTSTPSPKKNRKTQAKTSCRTWYWFSHAELRLQASATDICFSTGCPCGNCTGSTQCPGYRIAILILPPDISRSLKVRFICLLLLSSYLCLASAVVFLIKRFQFFFFFFGCLLAERMGAAHQLTHT